MGETTLRETLERALEEADSAWEWPDEAVSLRAGITQALTQLEALERDREAMEKLREEPGDLRWFGESEDHKPWTSYRSDPMGRRQQSPRKKPACNADDPADAILGTQERNDD